MENIELNQGPVRIAVRERPMVARELESECESVVYSKENVIFFFFVLFPFFDLLLIIFCFDFLDSNC